MKPKLLLLIVSLIFFSGFVQKSSAQVLANDSLALVDLYNSTGGPNWYFSKSWMTTAPVSEWYGVGLNGSRVNSLRLMGNNLVGKLPSSFYSLTELNYLNLYNNQLSGTIPSSVGNLTKLSFFELTGNKFSGSIPSSIGNLVQLTSLALDHNQFSGTIPTSIGNLKLLSVLSLESNSLSGALPSALGNLKSLTQLFLSTNLFKDSIPSALCTLPNLYTLSLSNNQLSGTLSSLSNLLNLQFLFLDNNRFTGVIPSSISNLKNLREVVLSNNRLTGNLPNTLSQCTSLLEFDVENNSLSGVLPSSVTNLPLLTNLYLSNNNLTGDLPLALLTMPNLQGVYLSHNHLTASQNYVVKTIGPNLSVVDISGNNFTFNALESIVQKVPNPVYSPQANLHVVGIGTKLTVSAGGTLKNNTYQWFKVGQTGSVTIKGDSTYQPKQSGQYYATVKNKAATQLILYSDTMSYTVPRVTLDAAPMTVSVYPNPATERITIHGLDNSVDVKITIADMSGYVWMNTMSRKQSSFAINVNRLKAGNYLVNISAGMEVKTLQFVKE